MLYGALAAGLLLLPKLLLPCFLQEEAKLLVATPAKFKKWFNVDVHESTEVTNIDRQVREAPLPTLRQQQQC